jgi:uncharacterized protein (DUF427 family)
MIRPERSPRPPFVLRYRRTDVAHRGFDTSARTEILRRSTHRVPFVPRYRRTSAAHWGFDTSARTEILRRSTSLKAIWNGVTIAESDDTVVVEGNHYFPEASLKREYTSFSNHRSSCPWKGQAHYYSLLVNGDMNENAVWYYPEPSEAAREIKGRVAFWKGVKVTE